MANTIEDELQRLLRGEISAAETYTQVLGGREVPNAHVLREMQQDHGRAIRFLREQLQARGAEPTSSSGVWGYFTRMVEGGAVMLGDKPALLALREGEQRGLQDYTNAAQQQYLPMEARQFIERELLPTQQRHVTTLDRLLESM